MMKVLNIIINLIVVKSLSPIVFSIFEKLIWKDYDKFFIYLFIISFRLFFQPNNHYTLNSSTDLPPYLILPLTSPIKQNLRVRRIIKSGARDIPSSWRFGYLTK